MSSDQNPNPYDNHERLTFESIGDSIWKVLMRVRQAQLAGAQLATSFFAYHAELRRARIYSENFGEILAGYSEIEEEAVHMLLLETRCHGLLSAIGAFDSFLSDIIRFLFLSRPSMIPSSVQPKKPAANAIENVERIVRYGELSRWEKRLEFLSSKFSIGLEPALVEELRVLIRLRNEIAHHGGLYKFIIDEKNGQVWAESKLVPEASFEEAQSALMIVSEISDAVLVAVCRCLFGEDPRVRILNPAVDAIHKKLRAEWAEKRSSPPEIEEILSPGWALKDVPEGSIPWIGDFGGNFLIGPSGIESSPLVLFMRKHTKHGAKAYATIDDNPRVELGMLHSREFVEQLLTGRSLLVEYYEDPWPGPQYARYSLNGFAKTWEEACRKKEGRSGDCSAGA